jgi:hypothetical protein
MYIYLFMVGFLACSGDVADGFGWHEKYAYMKQDMADLLPSGTYSEEKGDC